MHTFPACDESRRTWIESTCSRCPATSALLRRVPNIRTALFSRLGGGSRISGHRGWADLANHVLRCHLPLKVPSDGPCGLWVNEEVRARAVVLCGLACNVLRQAVFLGFSGICFVHHEVGVWCSSSRGEGARRGGVLYVCFIVVSGLFLYFEVDEFACALVFRVSRRVSVREKRK